MSHEPAGYGRTQMLAEVSHSLAQVAYVRLQLLERAFAALPGASTVDLDALANEALEEVVASRAAISREAAREALDESLARMRSGL